MKDKSQSMKLLREQTKERLLKRSGPEPLQLSHLLVL